MSDAIARAICCPSGRCCSPDACYLNDRSRPVLVWIDDAVAAVQALRLGDGDALREGDHPV